VSIENYIEQDLISQKWQDIGLVLLKKRSNQEEMVYLTQGVFIPDLVAQVAKEVSLEVSEEGYSCTVGSVIKDKSEGGLIDAHDWQSEAEFGGVSRKELLSDALLKGLLQEEIAFLKSQIVSYEGFPKPGICFDDFSPLLNNSKAFSLCIDLLYLHYKDKNIEAVVGLESRGFILGAALAYRLGVGFVTVRKPGKLPGPIHSVTYEKEYGVDTLAISAKGIEKDLRILIVDDLIATGGTAKAAIELIRLAGGNPVEFVSLLEVKSLEGRSKLGIPSFNLID
jgi:adenine phosphoribosyltransferase